MAGLDPAIHVFDLARFQDVDPSRLWPLARHKGTTIQSKADWL
jgi:hypothetical protein